MYQGAVPNVGRGAGRRSSSSGRGGKRRRGRGRKRASRRRNPTPATWILLAGGTAVVAGGGIAYALYRRKKKQGELPPVIPSGGGGSTSGGGSSGGSKVNAPSFPYSESEAREVEDAWANAEAAEAVTQSTGQTINQITDDAFYEMYKIRKIPKKSQQGSGWDPYIQSWIRLEGRVRYWVGQYGGSVS